MRYTLITVACSAATYLAFAFIFSSIDAREWATQDWGIFWRFACVAVGVLTSALVITEGK